MAEVRDTDGSRWRVPDVHEPRRVVRDEIIEDNLGPARFRRVYSDGSSEVFFLHFGHATKPEPGF